MEKFEKICPNCGRRNPVQAGFCPGCGTNIQAVQPTQTQFAAALNQLQSAASGVAGSIGKQTKGLSLSSPLKIFLPLLSTIITFIFYFGYTLITYKESDYGYGYTFRYLCEMEFFEEIEFWGVIIILFLIVGSLASLIGGFLQLKEKPLGKLLTIGGSFLFMVQTIIIFIAAAVESDGYFVPTFAGILIVLICLATIVCTIISFFKSAPAKVKTNTNNYQNYNSYPNQNYNNYNNYNNQF